VNRHATIVPAGGYPVKRIDDPAACAAALEAMDKIIKKNAKGVHGNPGVVSIFNNKKVPHKPLNHLSAPIPGAPVPSNLTIYRIRTSWILTPEDQARLLLWAKADDRRKNRPALAELDKSPLWPERNFCPWRKNWRKAWRRDRSRGIWPDPRHCTGYRWSKVALTLHFHKLTLKLSARRQWRHLPVDDRIAAALLGFSEAIHRFDPATHTNGITAYAIWWIRKELQRLVHNERRQPQGDHAPYGFAEGEFGPGTPMSFQPRLYPLIGYDEDAYRRRPQYVTVDGGWVENIKLGAPADDNDDVEHVGPSFANWSFVNPETTLLFKETAWEKYHGRSAEEIAQMLRDDKEIKLARDEGRFRCDASAVIDAAAVNAARRGWRVRKNRPRPAERRTASLQDYSSMVSLPASVFAPV
jgi:hypothetical protein